MRLSGRAFVVVVAALGILIVVSTDQIVPATSAYQAEMRLWLAGRATGITAYLLLTAQVVFGLILSHPVNQSTWKLSKRLFPWHENLYIFVPATSAYQAEMRLWLAGRATGITAYLLLTAQVVFGLILSHPVNQSTWKLSKRLFPWHENLYIFVLAFLGAHIVSLILDPYAGVGLGGAFIPGLSSYRTSPVALGTLSLYALLVTGLTARYTKLLPPGFWLKLHRFAIVALALGWIHGMLAGSDAATLQPMYVATGMLVLLATAYRYWVSKRRRPTFATSLRIEGVPRSPGHGADRSPGETISAGLQPTTPSTQEATR